MNTIKSVLFLTLYLLCFTSSLIAQDRIAVLESKLIEAAKKSPGLSENVDVSVNNTSIQEFLSGIASVHNLNVNVDPGLTIKISNSFSGITVSEVFVFLCKTYNLDISFTGSIMSFVPFVEAPPPVPEAEIKVLKITYDKQLDLLSYDLKEDTLYQVVKEMTRATEKNIICAPDISMKLVSGFGQNNSFGNGMTAFCIANDLKLTVTEENIFLLERKDKETTPVVAKPKGDKSVGNGATLIPGLNIVIENDSLVSVDAKNISIIEIIENVSQKTNNDYFLMSDLKGSATLKVSRLNYEDFLRNLLNATDYTFKKVDSIYLFGDRNIEGLRQTQILQLKYRTAEKIIEIIPADLKKGVELKAFPDLNAVIVSGSLPRINEIQSFLRDVDRVVPVVMIEVLIVDVRNTKTVSTGIQAGLGENPVKTKGQIYPSVDMTLNSSSINNIISGINGLGIINLGKVTPNFYLNIKALEEQGFLKLRSTPKLATLNGHEAKLSIGRTEYYQESQTTILGSVTSGSQTAISYKPINADLAVVINPMVSGDEQITLEIGVKQSNFTERISPTAPPGTITRDFQSLIRVKNEEMIILGGLEENTSNDTGSGVPILSRIPIIKWFFSSRTKSTARNKLTIFIKPTVIY